MSDASTISPGAAHRSVRVIDVGGSHVTAAIVESKGSSTRVARRVDRDIDPHAARAALLDSIVLPLRDVDPAARECVVAMPGPFDDETGVGSFDGVGKFASLAGVPLHAEFARRLGIDPSDVVFLNDAVAYGIGEWAHDVTRARRLVCITLGTGVGSAFLHDGSPVTGGPEVPEDGYAFRIRVHGVSLEDTASGRAIVRGFAERTGRSSTVVDIATAARRGDGAARDALDAASSALGLALGPWLERFAADELVVGGSISRSWDLLEGPLLEGLEAGGYVPATVRRSALLADAPLLGAADWYTRTSPAAPDAP